MQKQSSDKYARVSDKKRAQLIKLTVGQGVTIAQASKTLGIKYDNAKFIMRTFRLEKRTRKITHSERFQKRRKNVGSQVNNFEVKKSDNRLIKSRPLAGEASQSIDSIENDYEPDFKTVTKQTKNSS